MDNIINYVHNEITHNTTAAEEVLPYVFKIVNPGSVIDIGCGTGSWLKVAKQLGAKKISGVDGVLAEKSMLCIDEAELLRHDLTTPLVIENKYDLGICLEVAEHLPPEAADNIVCILVACSDVILFSAAIPGQGGQAHLNEQWPEYWQKKFAENGFVPVDILKEKFWDNARVEWWYKQNMLLYVNKKILGKLELLPADKIVIYIHPEQFELNMQKLYAAQKHITYLENILDTEVRSPRFFPTFKKLVKSLIK